MDDEDAILINGHFTAYEFLLEVTLAQLWATWSENDAKRVRDDILDRMKYSAYSSNTLDQVGQDSFQAQSVSIGVVEHILNKVQERAAEIRQSSRRPARQPKE